MTASDIIKAHRGTEIIPNVLQGKPARDSTLNWPKIVDVPKHRIEIFSSIIRDIAKPHIQSKPLGSWKCDDHQLFQKYINRRSEQIVSQESFFAKNESDRRIFSGIEERRGRVDGIQIYDQQESIITNNQLDIRQL